MANNYTTVQGDTWDIVSLRVYGSEKHIDVLIEANYKEQERFIFPAGIVLNVPDLPVETINSTNLPPWKRR